MSRKRTTTISLFATTCLALGAIGYFTYVKANSPAQAQPVNSQQVASIVGQQRPEFSMHDTSNKRHDIKEWDGKVILLNFWATWCPPCRHEIPDFIELYQKYHDKGFTIVGVALDSQQNAIDFVDPMGINYPILVGEDDGIALTQQYGNSLGVLPYSVIIDRHGVIRQTISHALDQKQVEQLIGPLL